jgi:preprotein translocase subunit SecG
MEWLETAVVVVHILVCLGLIGLVMIQQGKGAEAGASFGGGASQTVFGSQGSGSFLTSLTKYLAVIFFVTSISLAVIAKQKSEISANETLAPVIGESITVKPGDTSVGEGELDEASVKEVSSAELVELEGGKAEDAAPELE